MTSVFESLTEAQKKVVIDTYRYDYVRDKDWWDSVYAFFTEDMEKLGYDNLKIQFTLSYSQGDCAVFSANMDIQKYIKAHPNFYNKYRFLYQNCDATRIGIRLVGVGGGNYYMDTEDTEDYAPSEWTPLQEKLFWEQVDSLEKFFLAEAKDYAVQLYYRLRDQCDYYCSDEYLQYALVENEDAYGEEVADWPFILDSEKDKGAS